MGTKGGKAGGKTGIKDTIRGLRSGLNKVGAGLLDEDEFSLGGDGLPGSGGEFTIDRLFSSAKESSGDYIKLEKEISPNDFQFKDKITKFEHWTDFQYEVTKLVRDKTKIEIERTGRCISWGTANYRVTACNYKGMRDNSQSIVFSVDAEEWMIDPPKSPLHTAGPDVNEILRTIKETTLPPTDLLKQQGDAMKLGMELAVGRENRSADNGDKMMTMMMGLMTAVIGAIANKPVAAPTANPTETLSQLLTVAKDMGMLPDKTPPKSDIDMLIKFKELGLIQTPGNNGNGSGLDDLAKVSKVMSIVRELAGTSEGERPAIWEKLVESMGPQIPALAMKVLDLLKAGNAAPAVIQKPAQEISAPTQVVEQPASTVNPPAQAVEKNEPQGEDAQMIAKITKFSEELYQVVVANNTSKYAYITEQIKNNLNNVDVETMILSGQWNKDTLVQYIVQAEAFLNKTHYATPDMMQRLIAYVDGYVKHIIATGPYLARCGNCKGYAEYENKAHFDGDAEKKCDNCGSSPLVATL